MTKGKVIETLKKMKWLDSHWRLKDFIVLENENLIKYSYLHGDMGIVDKVIYYKNNGFCEIYRLNNYYGNTELEQTLYI